MNDLQNLFAPKSFDAPGFRVVSREEQRQNSSRVSIKYQPFEIYGYAGSPFYLLGRATEVIGNAVDKHTIFNWAKKGETSFGISMDTICIDRHTVIPEAKVLELKQLLPDRAALDKLVAEYKARHAPQRPASLSDCKTDIGYVSAVCAAEILGRIVTPETMRVWMKKGKAPKTSKIACEFPLDVIKNRRGVLVVLETQILELKTHLHKHSDLARHRRMHNAGVALEASRRKRAPLISSSILPHL